MKEIVEKVEKNVIVTNIVEKTFFVGECPICGEEQKYEDSDSVDIVCEKCNRHKDMMFKRNKWFEMMNEAVFEDIVYSYSDPYAFAFRKPDGTIFYLYIDEDTCVLEDVDDFEKDTVEKRISMNKKRDGYFNSQPKEHDPLEDYYKEKGLI